MKLLLVALLGFSTLSFAEDGGKSFEERKTKMLTHLDEKITHLNASKSCVSNASDEKALKDCREKMKEHRKDMKKRWKDKKKGK